MMALSLVFALLAICGAHPASYSFTHSSSSEMGNPRYRGFAGAGAYAGFGPRAYANPWFFPFWSSPSVFDWGGVFVPTINSLDWTQGPNVCVEKKTFPMPKELSDWLKEPSWGGDFSSSSKTCKGDQNTYVCQEKIQENGEMKYVGTKYTCCHGFEREPTGRPGCVEIPQKQTSTDQVTTEIQTTGYPKQPISSYRYDFSQ